MLIERRVRGTDVVDRSRSVRQAVDLVQRAEADNLHAYIVYADITEHFGLRRLLLSVADQITDHLDGWKSLVSTHFPDELFRVDDSDRERLQNLELPRMFDANMEYHDFLKTLHNREQAIASMYAVLAACARHPESRSLCQRHECDGRRHMEMARDRYELEVMMNGSS